MLNEQEAVSNDNERKSRKARLVTFLHRILVFLVLSAIFSNLAYCTVKPWLPLVP